MKKFDFDRYSTKRVSYILVTKNRARFLRKAQEMAKKLKKENDELIVVDGGSTDNTIRVIKSFGNLPDKFISEPDFSPAHAANKAILISSGKYIKYLTDDDVVYSDGMEKAIFVMDKNPEIDVLVCGGTRYRVRTKTLQVIYNPPDTNFGENIDDVFRHGVNAMGFVIRRSSLAKIGIAPIDLMSDHIFLLNCFQVGAIVKFCRLKLYHQNIHSKTINETMRPEMAKGLFKLVKTYASKSFFIRFAINWFFWEHPFFKPIVSPLVSLLGIYKKVLFVFSKKNRPKRIIWDGGFS